MPAGAARRALAFALPALAVLTIACGLGYTLVQHDLRSGANDPQIQLAEDAVAALESGASPGSVIPAGSVDLATSLAPWVAVDDAAGTSIAASGALDGAPPAPPPGVLAYAREHGQDRVTWEPRTGVRIALVAIPWTGGTVLAGRSLRLVEEREDATLMLAGLAWLVGLVGVIVAAAIAAWIWPGRTGPVAPA